MATLRSWVGHDPEVGGAAVTALEVLGWDEAFLAVDTDDPEALAAAVRRLRKDPDLRARLSEHGRAFAGRYLRERQANRLVHLIESQVDARPA
jgi:glycosyltransferase involved in cell wall biosynthesis